ncbi:MAG: ribosomal protein L7/L12 [Myxococcales bacterium]|nr:ribosomal protein L7/L12 [Myxococcales bacterium]
MVALYAQGPAGEVAAQSTGGRVGGFSSGGGSSGSSSYRVRPSTSSGSSGSTWMVSPEEERRASEARAHENTAYQAWSARRTRVGEAQLTEAERAAVASRRVLTMESWVQGLLGFGAGFLGMFALGGLVLAFLPARRATRRISIAFGPEARPVLQRRLKEIAASANAHTFPGRRALVKATLELLRAHLHSARYVVWQEHEEPKAKAEPRFLTTASDLRARYKHETVGAARAARPDLAPRPEEGPGLIVVSLLVLDTTRRGLPTTLDLDAALAAFEGVDLGVELIWSPSEDADRMSSAEAEALYPELVRITADVGRVACRFCGAIHARELGRCPACGAPGDGAALPEPRGELVDLVLESAGSQKIAVIKVVRELTGLGLAETKALVESAPTMLRQRAPRPEAEEAAEKLREVGASVSLR